MLDASASMLRASSTSSSLQAQPLAYSNHGFPYRLLCKLDAKIKNMSKIGGFTPNIYGNLLNK